VLVDVDDEECVAVAEKIINRPFESDLASFGEIQGHSNSPFAAHRFTKFWCFDQFTVHL